MTKFIVISPGRNTSQFVEKHISSVQAQTYRNFDHVLLDDASDDDTPHILLEYAQKHTSNVFVQINDKRMWACPSMALHLSNFLLKNTDVVINLDQDDWFAHSNVLATLDKVYTETACWMTYSNLQRSGLKEPDNVPPYSQHIVQRRDYRKAPWRFTGLKTFKGFLWLNLGLPNLLAKQKQQVTYACDIFIYLPMLEMTPPDKLKYIPEVLCVYNTHNPTSVINNGKRAISKRIYAEMKYREGPKFEIYKEIG